MDFERLLTENLGLLKEVVRGVARRNHLRDDEADELLGAVQLKLVEGDYAALRRFQGRAKLRTYLATIVAHHLRDERDRQLGKWRPSVFAQRAGPVAERLELLMTRDVRTFDEAVHILRTNHGVSESEEELYRLSLRIPPRTRRRFVDVQDVELPAAAGDPESSTAREGRADLARRVAVALDTACRGLDPQDRLLLKLYFAKGMQLSRIATLLQTDQKRLYRRKDQVLAALGRELQCAGITREEAREIVGEELEFDIGGSDDRRNDGKRSV